MQQSPVSALELSNLQKAAVVLISLGPEKSAEILSHLENDQVERIAREIARMEHLDLPTRARVLEEFSRRCRGKLEADRGGLQVAEEMVKKALGPQKAAQILRALKSHSGESALAYLQRADAGEITRLLADENPQVIALVLSSLQPQKAAAVLGALPEATRIDIARRIAMSDLALPGATARLAQALEKKASSLRAEQSDAEAGKRSLVEILKNADRSTERAILTALSEQDPQLVEFLREKLFVFEDLVKLNGKSVQLLIRELENDDLRIALRGAGEEIKEVVFRNMSEGARESLKEELETGQPVRLRDVEVAQRKIAGVLRGMVESGAVMIGQEEEQYV